MSDTPRVDALYKKHTIHYDIRNIRKAGFIAFADDLLKIMREYWHMKKALLHSREGCP